jgi:hypothetical protein
MNPQVTHTLHSPAWISFTYASFIGSIAMVGVGIAFAPLEIWVKTYFAMGAALLIQSCITATKTLRDVHEGGKLVNRLEDAKAERLLMELEREKARELPDDRSAAASAMCAAADLSPPGLR